MPVELTIISAKINGSSSRFNTVSPKVVVSFDDGQQITKFRTGISRSNRKPKWEQSFCISEKYITKDVLIFTIYNEYTTSEFIIGKALININEIKWDPESDCVKRCLNVLNDANKKVGKLLISLNKRTNNVSPGQDCTSVIGKSVDFENKSTLYAGIEEENYKIRKLRNRIEAYWQKYESLKMGHKELPIISKSDFQRLGGPIVNFEDVKQYVRDTESELDKKSEGTRDKHKKKLDKAKQECSMLARDLKKKALERYGKIRANFELLVTSTKKARKDQKKGQVTLCSATSYKSNDVVSNLSMKKSDFGKFVGKSNKILKDVAKNKVHKKSIRRNSPVESLKNGYIESVNDVNLSHETDFFNGNTSNATENGRVLSTKRDSEQYYDGMDNSNPEEAKICNHLTTDEPFVVSDNSEIKHASSFANEYANCNVQNDTFGDRQIQGGEIHNLDYFKLESNEDELKSDSVDDEVPMEIQDLHRFDLSTNEGNDKESQSIKFLGEFTGDGIRNDTKSQADYFFDNLFGSTANTDKGGDILSDFSFGNGLFTQKEGVDVLSSAQNSLQSAYDILGTGTYDETNIKDNNSRWDGANLFDNLFDFGKVVHNDDNKIGDDISMDNNINGGDMVSSSNIRQSYYKYSMLDTGEHGIDSILGSTKEVNDKSTRDSFYFDNESENDDIEINSIFQTMKDNEEENNKESYHMDDEHERDDIDIESLIREIKENEEESIKESYYMDDEHELDDMEIDPLITAMEGNEEENINESYYMGDEYERDDMNINSPIHTMKENKKETIDESNYLDNLSERYDMGTDSPALIMEGNEEENIKESSYHVDNEYILDGAAYDADISFHDEEEQFVSAHNRLDDFINDEDFDNYVNNLINPGTTDNKGNSLKNDGDNGLDSDLLEEDIYGSIHETMGENYTGVTDDLMFNDINFENSDEPIKFLYDDDDKTTLDYQDKPLNIDEEDEYDEAQIKTDKVKNMHELVNSVLGESTRSGVMSNYSDSGYNTGVGSSLKFDDTNEEEVNESIAVSFSDYGSAASVGQGVFHESDTDNYRSGDVSSVHSIETENDPPVHNPMESGLRGEDDDVSDMISQFDEHLDDNRSDMSSTIDQGVFERLDIDIDGDLHSFQLDPNISPSNLYGENSPGTGLDVDILSEDDEFDNDL